MNRMLKVVEIAWIVVAVISLIEIIRLWGTFDTTFFMFVGALCVGVFMFYFRRKQRIKYENYKKNKPQE
tara:strand:+ start:339 stop:545 length:207 start_codon:yes stop_codon:yes gene_type:complete